MEATTALRTPQINSAPISCFVQASHKQWYCVSAKAQAEGGGKVLRSQTDGGGRRHTVSGLPRIKQVCLPGNLRVSTWQAGSSTLLGGGRRSSQRRGRQLERAPLAACSCMTGTAVEGAASLFTFATVLVMPFYATMLFAPEWPTTKKLMNSPAPYLILGALYMYLLALSWTPQTLPTMFSSKYLLPELAGITRMFKSTLTVASAWMHILAMDLFAARHVYLDGLERLVPTRHSLVLCLMFGPIGIFCHFVTTAVVEWRRKNKGCPDGPDKMKRMPAMV